MLLDEAEGGVSSRGSARVSSQQLCAAKLQVEAVRMENELLKVHIVLALRLHLDGLSNLPHLYERHTLSSSLLQAALNNNQDMHAEVQKLRKQLEEAKAQSSRLQYQLLAATGATEKQPPAEAAADAPEGPVGRGCCFGMRRAKTAKAAVHSSAVHPA